MAWNRILNFDGGKREGEGGAVIAAGRGRLLHHYRRDIEKAMSECESEMSARNNRITNL